MSTAKNISPVLLFVAAMICLAPAVLSQDPYAKVAEVYLAKKAENGEPGERAEAFYPVDIPIFCIVRLNQAALETVKVDLIAHAVPGVKPDTKVVSLSYKLKEGEDRVNFSGKPHGKWVPGKYRIEVFVEDKLEESLTFVILQPAAKISNSKVKPRFASNGRKP